MKILVDFLITVFLANSQIGTLKLALNIINASIKK